MPDIFISTDDFLNECDSSECTKLLNKLAQDGHVDGYSTTTGNLDIDSIIEDLTQSEIEDMIEVLNEKGYIPNTISNNRKLSITENTFESAINKLHGKWNRLSSEEEEIILRVANKF